MKKTEYTEEEINNIKELERYLNKSTEYVSIPQGESKILKFLPRIKMEPEEKDFNGQKVEKIRFTVIEQDGNNQEKPFFQSKKSAQLILNKLKEGYTLLKVERIGSGKDTLYIPTVVSNDAE